MSFMAKQGESEIDGEMNRDGLKKRRGRALPLHGGQSVVWNYHAF